MRAAGAVQVRGADWRSAIAMSVVLLICCLLASAVAAPRARALDPSSAAAEAVIEAASAYLGLPYRLGTEGPDRFDCSGLIFTVFSDVGRAELIGGRRIRAAGYQRWFAARGQFTADASKARRGDLVMYDHGKHIGFYLGGDKVLSAVLSGVSVHHLHGLTQEVTGFLRVDWDADGSEGGTPVNLEGPVDEDEQPAELIAPSAWAPEIDGDITASQLPGEERVDLRTAASRTFETAQGDLTTELFSRPIFFQPAGAADWQPIDLRLTVPRRGPSAIVRDAPVEVVLEPARRQGDLVTLAGAGHSMALGATGVPRGVVIEPLIAPDGRFADYQGLFAGQAGLRLFPRADGIKAFLVLSERPATDHFDLRISSNLLGAESGDGSIHWTAPKSDGAVVARMARPLAISSADDDGSGGGVSTDAARLELRDDGDGQLVRVRLDRAYLGRAAYPIFVDLTIGGLGPAGDPGSTFVLSSRPDANFSTFQRPEAPAHAELWHGRLPGRKAYSETFVRFAPPPPELLELGVDSARLRMLPYWQHADHTATQVSLPGSDWQAGALTWDSRPAASSELGTLVSRSGEWAELDVTSHLSAVYAGERADNGYLLHANELGQRGWKRIVASSGDPLAAEPRLVVSWRAHRPTPFLPEASPTAGR